MPKLDKKMAPSFVSTLLQILVHDNTTQNEVLNTSKGNDS